MKRKLKWLSIVLAVSLLGFGTALLLWPRDRITAESWQKIRIGMTEEEVAEILGNPGISEEEFQAKDVRLEKILGRLEIEDLTLEEPEARGDLVWNKVRIWTGRRGRILIDLDEHNHVCWKRFEPVRWIDRSILDRLRDWLGW